VFKKNCRCDGGSIGGVWELDLVDLRDPVGKCLLVHLLGNCAPYEAYFFRTSGPQRCGLVELMVFYLGELMVGAEFLHFCIGRR
jgi:hypothetical protein